MIHDSFARAVNHFNDEAYREALLAFEERWVRERSDFLKALIQLSNALLQLRLGLVTAPRRTLATAEALLIPYLPSHEGVDVVALRDYIARVRACIPDGIETGDGSVAWNDVPRMTLQLYKT